MSRYAQQLTRHQQRLRTHRGLAVVYRRQASQVEISDAVPAASSVTVDDGQSTAIRSRQRDWLIDAASLVLDGELAEPRVGDRIEIAEAGAAGVYEVQRLAGQDCWQWMDQPGGMMRVHSRHVDTTQL